MTIHEFINKALRQYLNSQLKELEVHEQSLGYLNSEVRDHKTLKPFEDYLIEQHRQIIKTYREACEYIDTLEEQTKDNQQFARLVKDYMLSDDDVSLKNRVIKELGMEY
jgi:hypothetical protein